MWAMVRSLRDRGVTIILTTHYIEEAEEMADRVGVISKGRLILVEEKHALIKKLGRKTLTLNLAEPLAAVPGELAEWRSEEHTSELQSLMRISYAVFCLKKYTERHTRDHTTTPNTFHQRSTDTTLYGYRPPYTT